MHFLFFGNHQECIKSLGHYFAVRYMKGYALEYQLRFIWKNPLHPVSCKYRPLGNICVLHFQVVIRVHKETRAFVKNKFAL